MSSMTVTDMVEKHLKDNGFDGLFQPDVCACLLDDLAPCGEMRPDCEAGYRSECPADGDSPGECEGTCGFHVGPVKI